MKQRGTTRIPPHVLFNVASSVASVSVAYHILLQDWSHDIFQNFIYTTKIVRPNEDTKLNSVN